MNLFIFSFILDFEVRNRFELLNNIEIVLITKETPDDRYVLDYNYERYRTQRADHAAYELQITEAAHAERLDGADEIQVQVDCCDETAKEVERLPDRYRVESG